MTYVILHGLTPNYDPIVLKENREFLRYRANKQTSPHVVLVAQPDVFVAGNSFTCVSQSSTLGSWVIDSVSLWFSF